VGVSSQPVLAHRSKKFDPAEAFELMRKYKVRNTFMPPTALKLMRQAIGDSQTVSLRYPLSLASTSRLL
jgi:acetyl-CoA synthetase